MGAQGRIYILASLDNGKQFMKVGPGKFMPYNGDLGSLVPAREGVLASVEDLTVVQGLQGLASGFSGVGFQVFLGYALSDSPSVIHYSTTPIQFSIDPAG